jgi:hypothetical protein
MCEEHERTVVREEHNTTNFSFSTTEQVGKIHARVAGYWRDSYMKLSDTNTRRSEIFVIKRPKNPHFFPIIFEDVYSQNANPPAELLPEHLKEGINMFVLVHGFQGTSFDM